MPPAETIEHKQAESITMDASHLRLLADMARQGGVAIESILDDLGLPQDLWAGSPDAKAPLAHYYRLLHLLSIAVDDETCQLSSRQLLPGTIGFILSHLHGAQTFYDAMKVMANNCNLLHGGEYNSVRRREDVVTFMIDDREFPYTLKDNAGFVRFSTECVQILLHCMFAMVSPSSAVAGLKRVSVTRRRGEAGGDHLAFWEVPVRYGAPVYSIDYDGAAAAAALCLPPAELLTASRVYAHVVEMVEARGPSPGMTESVEALVRECLRDGAVDQRRVARLLDMSVATLRRRLSEEGATFRGLRKEVLNGEAQALLRKGRPVADIAEALGFSDFRSFNRAFKEWNGVTPRAFAERVSSGTCDWMAS